MLIYKYITVFNCVLKIRYQCFVRTWDFYLAKKTHDGQ